MKTKLFVLITVVALVLSACTLPGMKTSSTSVVAPTQTTAPVATVAKATATLTAVAPATATPTKVVEPTAALTSVLTNTPTVAPTPMLPNTPTSVSSCRHIEWFTDANEGALKTTTDVAGLLAKLDRDFQHADGGQWSNAGFTVPANTVFWTDLLNQELPLQVRRIRTQGNWGIYTASAEYLVPSPNGGGRFLRVCEGVAALPAQANKVPAAVTTVTSADKVAACITADEVSGILKATDPVVAYNAYFEGKGYRFGKNLGPGEKVRAGFYLGTFPKDSIPSTVTSLDKATGFLWQVDAETQVQGGRWMKSCK